MTSAAQASQFLLQNLQQEPRTYGMKVNQSRCEHIGLNAIHRIQYENGEEVPTTQAATYGKFSKFYFLFEAQTLEI